MTTQEDGTTNSGIYFSSRSGCPVYHCPEYTDYSRNCDFYSGDFSTGRYYT